MIKDTLYISAFSSKNHYDCVGLSQQIQDNENLLCVFEDITIKNHYNSFLNSINAYNKYSENFSDNLIDLIKDYQYNYKYFVFLKTNKIILSEFRDKIVNQVCTVMSGCRKIFLYKLDLNNIVKNFKTFEYSDLISEESTLPSIKSLTVDSKFFPDLYYLTNTITENKYIHHTVSNYEDDFCGFYFSQGFENYSDSMIFINKQKNKVYNIKNNIIGNCLYFDDSIMIISWIIDDNLTIVKYNKTKVGYMIDA